MDELGIYDDLDDFHEQEQRKSKELLSLEVKYNEALQTIEAMKIEKKDLRKKVRIMEQNLQSLLDTAKAEIKRKDKLIVDLRKEKDDICFRRRGIHPYKASAKVEVIEKPFSISEQKCVTEELKVENNRCKVEETFKLEIKPAVLEENLSRVDLKTKVESKSTSRVDQRHTSSHHRRKDDSYDRRKNDHRHRQDEKLEETKNLHHKSRKRSRSPNKNDRDIRKIEKKDKEVRRKYDNDEKYSSRKRHDSKDNREAYKKCDKKFEAKDRDKSLTKGYDHRENDESSSKDRKRRRSIERDNKEDIKHGRRSKQKEKLINSAPPSNFDNRNKLDLENIDSSDDEFRNDGNSSKKGIKAKTSIEIINEDDVKKIEKEECKETNENIAIENTSNKNDIAKEENLNHKEHKVEEYKAKDNRNGVVSLVEEITVSEKTINNEYEKVEVIKATADECQNFEEKCDIKSKAVTEATLNPLNTPTKVALYDSVFGVAKGFENTTNNSLLENIKDIFKNQSSTETLEINGKKCIESKTDIDTHIKDSESHEINSLQENKNQLNLNTQTNKSENVKPTQLENISKEFKSSISKNEDSVKPNSIVSKNENCSITNSEKLSRLEDISNKIESNSKNDEEMLNINNCSCDPENRSLPGLNDSIDLIKLSNEAADDRSVPLESEEKSSETNEKLTIPSCLNLKLHDVKNCDESGLEKETKMEYVSKNVSKKRSPIKKTFYESRKKSYSLSFYSDSSDEENCVLSDLKKHLSKAQNSYGDIQSSLESTKRTHLETKRLNDKNIQKKDEEKREQTPLGDCKNSTEIKIVTDDKESTNMEPIGHEKSDKKLLGSPQNSLEQKTEVLLDLNNGFVPFATSAEEKNIKTPNKSGTDEEKLNDKSEVKTIVTTEHKKVNNNPEESEDKEKEKDNSFFSLTLSSDEDDDDDDDNMLEDAHLQTEEFKEMKEKIEIIENIRLPMLFQLTPGRKNSPRKEREKLKKKEFNEKHENKSKEDISIPVVDLVEEKVSNLRTCNGNHKEKHLTFNITQSNNDTTKVSSPKKIREKSPSFHSIFSSKESEQKTIPKDMEKDMKTKNKTEDKNDVLTISENSNIFHSISLIEVNENDEETNSQRERNIESVFSEVDSHCSDTLSNDANSEIALKQLRDLEEGIKPLSQKKVYVPRDRSTPSPASLTKLKNFIKLDTSKGKQSREQCRISERSNNMTEVIKEKLTLETSEEVPKVKRSPLKPQKSQTSNKLQQKSPMKKYFSSPSNNHKNQKRKFPDEKNLEEEPQKKITKLANTSAEVCAMLIDGKSPKVSNDIILSSSRNSLLDTNLDELERDMQAIFQSPIKIENNSPINLCDPSSNSTKLDAATNNDGDSSIITTNNHSNASDNSFDSKCLSLGSSQYIVERVSENVVNLFVTRRRSKKRANKSLNPQIEGST